MFIMPNGLIEKGFKLSCQKKLVRNNFDSSSFELFISAKKIRMIVKQ
jgi:hypothetical protein